MEFKTKWYVGGFRPNGKCRIVRFDGGVKEEKIVNVSEIQNINKI